MLARRVVLSGLAAMASANVVQIPGAWSAEEDHVVHSDAEWRASTAARFTGSIRACGMTPHRRNHQEDFEPPASMAAKAPPPVRAWSI